MNKVSIFVLTAVLSGCSLLKPDEAPQVSPEVTKPAVIVTPEPKVTKVVRLRDTFYYILAETRFSSSTEATIKDPKGNVLGSVSAKYKRLCDIEGTCRLRSGLLINYWGKVAGDVRYVKSPFPYGVGVGNCPLKPFRTAAVDKSVVPFGSTIRVKELVGATLPDGSKHDGIMMAQDAGGAIKNDRIDLFLGDDYKGDFLTKAKVRHMQPLTVEILDTPIVFPCK